MIGAYLTELERELRLPARLRRRVLAEAADHLHESAAAFVDEGMAPDDAEWAAVAAFGRARELARRFADELATRAVRRAAWVTCAAAVGFGLSFALTARGGVVAFFAVQVAFVAGLATLIRLLRHHGEHAVPAAELRLIQRGSGLALACAAVARPAAPVFVAVAVAAAAVASAQPRAAAARAFGEEPAEDIVEDVRALAARYGLRLPRIELRWPIALVVALGCGVLAAAGHAQEYAGGQITWRAFLAGAVIVAVEAAMVIAGYALFGRFIGVSPSGRRSRRPPGDVASAASSSARRRA